MFTLLDSAASAGLIKDPSLQNRWRETNPAISGRPIEELAEPFIDLLVDLDRAGAIKGSWIGERWTVIHSRLSPKR